MLNRRGPIAKLVGGAIGLTKEYQADRKERKTGESTEIGAGEPPHGSSASNDHRMPAQQHGGRQSYSVREEDYSDDEDWALNLDEVQQQLPGGNAQECEENTDIDALLRDFIRRHPVSYAQKPSQGRLPLPVILPQRRPESRHRGFVRAYAPVLEDCDIDQSAWLEFLDGFEKSINANPLFHVANGAVFVAGHVSMAVSGVSVLASFVTMAIHLSVEASRRTYVHYQQNKYLDTMNEQFFKPRGLYCLVIKYKPASDELMEEVDLEHNVAKTIEKRDGQSKWKHLVSASSATTKHDAEIPEAAPLIFPQLDNMDETQKQNSVKRFGNFMKDYHDRQAAAKFETQNPDSKIPNVPRKEFASKYSDPNHPASTGGLISIASGGKYNPVGPLGRIKQRRADQREEMGMDPPVDRKERKKNRPMHRLLKADALYLMVVNMPTQEEMDRVMAEVNKA
ncbi:hypothetical protein JX265_002185 [Neoarthrinium moseri]|uniref:Uncharacterized protein n=1 Tax=Neoarthrinium moseri TaxID=1658444 RepID=A0A9P9WUL1_9PEZI|nr:hypothetical protein JX265_002185 [Neoarthrinium moseri]